MTELFQQAHQRGIQVEYCRLPLNLSISAPDPEGDFILMDYSLIRAGARERVHLAHELGHCVTGSFYSRHTARELRQKHENRADKWAIVQLVPAQALAGAVQQGYTQLWELAELFGVTEEFMKKALCYYRHGHLCPTAV